MKIERRFYPIVAAIIAAWVATAIAVVAEMLQVKVSTTMMVANVTFNLVAFAWTFWKSYEEWRNQQ